jgi:hypothetical protein
MQTKKVYYLIAGIVVGLVIYMIADTLMQPGVADLRGDYREIAFFRNENNTGPVIRVYAVFAADTLWDEFQQYGDFMPHTKYGNTKVFFFLDQDRIPNQVSGNSPYFPAEFESYCVGMYEKSAMGQTKLLRYPFR